MASISTVSQLDCALPYHIVQRLKECAKELQMMPAAATKAIQLMERPDCSIRSLANVIEKDVKLATSILSLSNSPFYSPGRPIGDIREAVVQVGFRQCHNLIQASCVTSLMERLSGKEAEDRDAILQHSLTTAMFAVRLSSLLNLNLHGMEFTAGLMHDIGRLLLSVLVPQEFSVADRVDFNEREWIPDEEQAALETDHCVVGCVFAVNNTLPDPICEAIRFHHCPERAEISAALTCVTSAADDFANFVARNVDACYEPEGNVGLSSLLQLAEVESALTLEEVSESLLATDIVSSQP